MGLGLTVAGIVLGAIVVLAIAGYLMDKTGESDSAGENDK